MMVRCNECGKFLFRTREKSPGAIGCIAQEKGFIYKNAVLFSEIYSSLFFCNHICGKEFYKKHIPPNPKTSQSIKEAKLKIPEMAKDVSQRLSEFQERIKHIANGRRK